jgi:diaminopimelate decarboxylase
MSCPLPTADGSLRSQIAGLGVSELAARFGTPTFFYDARVILRRLGELAAFDVVRYAQKACSNLAILDLLRRHGALVDTVSAGEIRRAMAAGYAAGSGGQEGRKGDSPHLPERPFGCFAQMGTVPFSAPAIVYTADVFDAEALELCAERGIHVNCGSPDMIDQLGQNTQGVPAGRELTLRINPGFGHGHSRKTNTGGDQSKHGIWHEQLGACLERAAGYGLRVTGLHMHIGSGSDLDHLSQVAAAMEKAAGEVGPQLVSISAGGGLPIPYRQGEPRIDLAAYFAIWDAARKRLEDRFGHRLRLECEPGRYIVAESGFLLAEIRAVKQQGQRWFYLLDAGFNNLARPILYGAYHPISIAPADGRSGARGLREVIVGGPLCESGDIFTQSEGGYVAPLTLPEARVGDWAVIECAGAYGFVMGSNYNSRPLAAEVLIQNGRARAIRRRQTFEELIAGETIPGRA